VSSSVIMCYKYRVFLLDMVIICSMALFLSFLQTWLLWCLLAAMLGSDGLSACDEVCVKDAQYYGGNGKRLTIVVVQS